MAQKRDAEADVNSIFGNTLYFIMHNLILTGNGHEILENYQHCIFPSLLLWQKNKFKRLEDALERLVEQGSEDVREYGREGVGRGVVLKDALHLKIK